VIIGDKILKLITLPIEPIALIIGKGYVNPLCAALFGVDEAVNPETLFDHGSPLLPLSLPGDVLSWGTRAIWGML